MKLDDKIRQLVTARELDVPSALQRSIDQEIRSRLATGTKTFRRRLIFLPSLAAGLVLILLSALVLIKSPATTVPEISEIRTEFYLSDNDIKVIWIQTDNFKLRRTNP